MFKFYKDIFTRKEMEEIALEVVEGVKNATDEEYNFLIIKLLEETLNKKIEKKSF